MSDTAQPGLGQTAAARDAVPLLARVSRGDPDAMSECLDRFGNLVWSIVRKQIRADAEAEDIVQDIFVDVWKSAKRYDSSIASEATFIAMIARRRIIDRRRRVAGTREHTVLDDIAPAAEPPATPRSERAEDVARAAGAFARLSEDQRRVLQLSISHGLSHERISDVTGMPLGTVKTHARRGLIRLRDLMAASAKTDRGGGVEP